MSNLAGFSLPIAAADSKLHRILAAALPIAPSPVIDPQLPAWPAEFFNLHQVQIFQDATPTEQRQILAIAQQDLLAEAYWIEQAGVGYMAKMVLFAETQEERQLYGLFTADEVQHLAQIQQFLPAVPVANPDPFLLLLADFMESQDKAVLLLVLQVVLEGWGLTHYRQLAAGCQQPALQACFASFVAAESRHHGTGVVLFNQQSASKSSEQAMVEILSQFLRLIQVGPQRVVSAIAQVKGHLSRSQMVQILEELDTLSHSGQRLTILRHLMQTPQTQRLIEQLTHAGYFQPLSADLCVS